MLNITYLAHDEYFMTMPGEFSSLFDYDLMTWMSSVGRPIGGLCHEFVGGRVSAMDDAKTLRALNIMLIAVTALLFASFLLDRSVPTIDAALIALIAGCLTPLQVTAGYFSALYAILGLFFGMMSGLFLMKWVSCDQPLTRPYPLLGGSLFFIMALCSYQTTAFVFFALCIFPVAIETNDSNAIKRFFGRFGIAAVFWES